MPSYDGMLKALDEYTAKYRTTIFSQLCVVGRQCRTCTVCKLLCEIKNRIKPVRHCCLALFLFLIDSDSLLFHAVCEPCLRSSSFSLLLIDTYAYLKCFFSNKVRYDTVIRKVEPVVYHMISYHLLSLLSLGL